MLEAGWNVMARVEVEVPMHGYPDLAVLAELAVQRFLVAGFWFVRAGTQFYLAPWACPSWLA